MPITPFKLERYFAQYEFDIPYALCCSDSESFSIQEILNLEPGSQEAFLNHRLSYTESQGSPLLRKQIANLYQQTSAHDILLHAGQEGIFLFMSAVLEQTDHIIVQSPCYQSLYSLAEDRGIRVTHWKANETSGWSLDLNFLKDAITPQTKAIVINLPHNPTGFLMNQKDWSDLIDIARAKNIILFSDEVYRFLEHNPSDRLPAAHELYENAVSLGVMAKSFGLPGLRIGWLATHNKELLKRMATFKDFTTICSSAPSEFLATIALMHRNIILSRNVGIIKDNLQLLLPFINKHKNLFSWHQPKAGPIGFIRLADGINSSTFCREAIEKAGILLLPSTVYDYGERHWRIGFGKKDFPEALAKFDEYLVRSYASKSPA